MNFISLPKLNDKNFTKQKKWYKERMFSHSIIDKFKLDSKPWLFLNDIEKDLNKKIEVIFLF